jgi:small subunit ribosomal protein S27e
VFEKASTIVKCIVCGHDLALPTGGKASIKAEILSELK